MEKIKCFIVGLLYLPFMAIVMSVEYITNLGHDMIEGTKIKRRMRKYFKEKKKSEV